MGGVGKKKRRYMNDENYNGGWDVAESNRIIDSLEVDYRAGINELRLEVTKHWMRTISRTDLRVDLDKVSVQSRIIQAAHDPSVPLWSVKYLKHNLGGQTTLKVLKLHDHRPHICAPEMVASALWRNRGFPFRHKICQYPVQLPLATASKFAPIARAPLMKYQWSYLWKKEELLGRGSFGEVYVAANRVTGAICAMKEVKIFPNDQTSEDKIKLLEHEIEILSNLSHRNIVQYYGSAMVEDKLCVYMEYVHPGAITTYMKKYNGTMTENIVRNFTRQILSGLAYLHSKNIVHRDIKGANLLVDASGVVKLADFGMAKLLDGQEARLSIKGTENWMAPELIRGKASPDFALLVDI